MNHSINPVKAYHRVSDRNFKVDTERSTLDRPYVDYYTASDEATSNVVTKKYTPKMKLGDSFSINGGVVEMFTVSAIATLETGTSESDSVLYYVCESGDDESSMIVPCLILDSHPWIYPVI